MAQNMFQGVTYLDWLKAVVETLIEANNGNILGDAIPSPFTHDFHMLIAAVGGDLQREGREEEVNKAIDAVKKHLSESDLEEGVVLICLFEVLMNLYAESVEFARQSYITKGMQPNGPRAN